MAAERLGSHKAQELIVWCAMEVEGIVKLRSLYAARRRVLGEALRPWVWFMPSFTTNGSTLGSVDRANVPMEGVKFQPAAFSG